LREQRYVERFRSRYWPRGATHTSLPNRRVTSIGSELRQWVQCRWHRKPTM